MKFYILSLISLLSFTIISCNNSDDDTSQEKQAITIGAYTFDFPLGYELKELQGIDSFIGNINGPQLSLSFDYGWYGGSATGLSQTDFEIIVDTVQGHYRQVVRAIDPSANFTSLHMYKVSDSIASPYGFNSLSMVTRNISQAQQNFVVQIFNDVGIE